MPIASFVATRAIGNPVALLASALLRERRGLTSMMTTSPFAGFPPNWILAPPPLMPI